MRWLVSFIWSDIRTDDGPELRQPLARQQILELQSLVLGQVDGILCGHLHHGTRFRSDGKQNFHQVDGNGALV